MSSSKSMCLLVTIGRLKEHFYVAINSSVTKTELHVFFKGIFGWSKKKKIQVRLEEEPLEQWKERMPGRGKGKAREGEASAKVETQKCSLSPSNI